MKQYTAQVTHYCNVSSLPEHEFDQDIEVEDTDVMAWIKCPRCGAEALVAIVEDGEYDQGFSFYFDPVE